MRDVWVDDHSGVTVMSCCFHQRTSCPLSENNQLINLLGSCSMIHDFRQFSNRNAECVLVQAGFHTLFIHLYFFGFSLLLR